MQINDIALGLILGVTGSIIATAICATYLKKRQRNIRRKIEELDYEEKFIEKISKGNVALIRSGFRVFSLCLFMVFSSGAAVLAANLFPFPKPLEMLISLRNWCMDRLSRRLPLIFSITKEFEQRQRGKRKIIKHAPEAC